MLCDGDPKRLLTAVPVLDRPATTAMAERLFPGEKLTPLDDGSLIDTCPADNELVIGSFAGLTIVAAKEFAIDYPSRLPLSFITATPATTVYLHAMHSVVDWFAYAVWQDGQLQRSLSVSPDSGIIEDIGVRRPFESPFWEGQHRVCDPEEEGAYPLDFHPLEMGEAALSDLFGYRLEGVMEDVLPETVALMRFQRCSARWWKFWK